MHCSVGTMTVSAHSFLRSRELNDEALEIAKKPGGRALPAGESASHGAGLPGGVEGFAGEIKRAGNGLGEV